MNASPIKLRDGSWGAKTTSAVKSGDTVTITTRAGKSWTATVGTVVSSSNGAWIFSTVSGGSSRSSAPSKSPRSGSRSSARTSAPRQSYKPIDLIGRSTQLAFEREMGTVRPSEGELRAILGSSKTVENKPVECVGVEAYFVHSSEQAEDMGHYGKHRGWYAILHYDTASPAVAASEASKQLLRAAEQAAKTEAREAPRKAFEATLAEWTDGLVRTGCGLRGRVVRSEGVASISYSDGARRCSAYQGLVDGTDRAVVEASYFGDDWRDYLWTTPEARDRLILAWAQERDITRAQAVEWLAKYGGCDGADDYGRLVELTEGT